MILVRGGRESLVDPGVGSLGVGSAGDVVLGWMGVFLGAVGGSERGERDGERDLFFRLLGVTSVKGSSSMGSALGCACGGETCALIPCGRETSTLVACERETLSLVACGKEMQLVPCGREIELDVEGRVRGGGEE